ncbi:TPM domain-containing protein [Gilliamella sp. wkB112]|uniref:TPM domain-containing protein n=1 Tax=Gilliamella sp. wkB112 TaxID=3120257 RepID=UPI00080DEC5D|nr:TPM domain-containing protein [Gilliamella apicola]OCG00273.1 hypothetical protein A9G12_04080 [Gilliamella apicola]
MKRYLAISILLIISWCSYGLTDIPALKQRVVDTTNTLTSTQVLNLELSLIEFEKPRTDGAQIIVLMIAKLENETIEQYAERVFRTWEIGRKGLDNGILLLIAKDDRRMRIEVGYGLEGTITDLLASRIIREQLTPQFKQNNYYQGINNAIIALKKALANPEEQEQNRIDDLKAAKYAEDYSQWVVISFIICFIFSHLAFKSLIKRALVTGILNGISISGFELWNGSPLLEQPEFFLMNFISSAIMCFFIYGFLFLTKIRINRNDDNNHHSGGSFNGGSGGSSNSFSGGGGGRSGGGGASGSW